MVKGKLFHSKQHDQSHTSNHFIVGVLFGEMRKQREMNKIWLKRQLWNNQYFEEK